MCYCCTGRNDPCALHPKPDSKPRSPLPGMRSPPRPTIVPCAPQRWPQGRLSPRGCLVLLGVTSPCHILRRSDEPAAAGHVCPHFPRQESSRVWLMPDTPSGPRMDQMTWLLQTMATQPDCLPGPTARQWESVWVWDSLFLLCNRFTASIFRDKIFLELIF